MKLGLLQCDHVLPEFRTISGDYDEMFRRWLPADWTVFDVMHGERPDNLDDWEAYVTTGSRASVYDDEPWIHGFRDLVRELHTAQCPMLGVCFGHQMMAHALGGRVARSTRGWSVGVHEFGVMRTEAWMEPQLNSFRVLMSCQDQVEELPADATILAGNIQCPVALFRTGKMLGLQGHPEFSSAYAEALLRHRRNKIGYSAIDAAQATIQRDVHSAELASWALHFLGSPP